MHYVMRSKYIILGLILSLVLASCSTSNVPVKESADNEAIYYIAKVELGSTDTKLQIETEYGAKAIFFDNKAGFAVLGFSKAAGELTSLSTTINQDAFSTPEVAAQGFNAWSGGFNAWSGGFNAWSGGFNAWSGGYNSWAGGFNAWAGGYNSWAGGFNAWAGGFNAWAGGLPMSSMVGDNMHVWDRINLAEGQLRAPNLGEGVVVAVIDTGIDANHPQFAGHLVSGSDWMDYVDDDNKPYDDGIVSDHGHGHGTAVASLVLKVAPKAKIMPLRVLNRDGLGDTDDVVSAIGWAVTRGADVINLSLGTNVHDPALSSMVNWASSQGVYVVTSVGNTNTNGVTYPAAYSSLSNKIFSIGSVNLHYQKSDFSNYGTGLLDIVTPGEGLITAYPNSKQATVKGTSFSAPIAAGAIALALGQNPTASNQDNLKKWMRNSALNINKQNPDYSYMLGKGLLDIEHFLDWMGNTAPIPRRKALFVVGHTWLTDSDKFFKERLELLGFSVTVVQDSASTISQANANDLVLISNTVDETKIGSRFLNVAVPVILWEKYLFDDMSLAFEVGVSNSQTNLRIKTSHPLSAGFGKYQTKKVYYNSDDGTENRLGYGKVYSSAIRVATVPYDFNKVTVFAYEKGAALGTIWAPAKRVGLFFQNYKDLPISNYGAAMFDAAVVWTTNDRYELAEKTWLEAEAPSSVEGGFTWGSGASWEISSGSYMTTPDSLGSDTDGNGSPNAKLNYKLKVLNSGTYHIWLRSYGIDNDSNSFFVQIDDDRKIVVNLSNGTWGWKKTDIYMTSGEHTLTVSLREDASRLDKILLTKNDSYTPTGLGDY